MTTISFVLALRSGALTPSAVRTQLNRVRVFHFDPGRMLSNGRLAEKRSSYPSDGQKTTDSFCCVSFDPSRLGDHLSFGSSHDESVSIVSSCEAIKASELRLIII